MASLTNKRHSTPLAQTSKFESGSLLSSTLKKIKEKRSAAKNQVKKLNQYSTANKERTLN